MQKQKYRKHEYFGKEDDNELNLFVMNHVRRLIIKKDENS